MSLTLILNLLMPPSQVVQRLGGALPVLVDGADGEATAEELDDLFIGDAGDAAFPVTHLLVHCKHAALPFWVTQLQSRLRLQMCCMGIVILRQGGREASRGGLGPLVSTDQGILSCL